MIDSKQLCPETIQSSVKTACGQIAPTWPLDRQVAVNPLWQLIDRPISQAASILAARGGARVVPDRSYFLEQWERGRIQRADLEAARSEAGIETGVDELLASLDLKPASDRLQLVADVLDADRDLTHRTAWRDEITHQISQLCASEFDLGQGDWPVSHQKSLYPAWQYNVARDRGIPILMGEPGLQQHFHQLPPDADALIFEAVEFMKIPDECLEAYLHALLLSINGWASWCAYLGWQASLEAKNDANLHELLAVRLAWDRVLYEHVATDAQRHAWHTDLLRTDRLTAHHHHDQQIDWIWQRALEMGYQKTLVSQLSRIDTPRAMQDRPPSFQAAFCIDVRSEVFRRCLEHVAGNDVQTLGFAGFFGAPIAYQPHGLSHEQPQLPGLLAPSLTAIETPTRAAESGADTLGTLARLRLGAKELSRRFRWGPTSTFSYVESMGLFYAFKLFVDGFLKNHADHTDNGLNEAERQKLQLELAHGPTALSTEEKTELAASILAGLSLTRDFAPIVLLVGHASATRNNPKASTLDCGACCGRSGEVNARVVARLLNEADVRASLAAKHDIRIGDDTQFVGGLHNTTTDAVSLFDVDGLDSRQTQMLAQVKHWLEEARVETNAERLPWLDEIRQPRRHQNAGDILARRGNDWSQVRPEWGLTGNASLIIAPRARTRELNFGGRTFLHDYNEAEDPDGSVLETILTAPMVVAHWINFQYYASTVDNTFYGSGNKTLHNVAGGHIAVFEGNGGDMRIGLSLQSLHDGEKWIHEPLRLSVFVQASTQAIDQIMASHDSVRYLATNKWLFLYAIGDPGEPIHRFIGSGWQPIDAESHASAEA